VARKVILSINTTLDSFMAGPAGELDWVIPDAAMGVDIGNALRAQVDTILVGRNTYETFDRHYRTQATDPASPRELAKFARWMIETPKVVFSRKGIAVASGSRLAHEEIPDEIEALKRQPGRDLVLFGGVSTVRQFIQLSLVDEFWFKMHPIALGSGQPIFDKPEPLRLLGSRAYPSGVLGLRFQRFR
jgi:dihydrofolate reductase